LSNITVATVWNSASSKNSGTPHLCRYSLLFERVVASAN